MSDTPTTTEPVAKPFYMSATVLSLVAGILLAVLAKFGKALGFELPPEITTESTIQFLTVVIPMLVAIWGRIRASHTLTLTPANAKIINQVATDDSK